MIYIKYVILPVYKTKICNFKYINNKKYVKVNFV